MHERCHWTTRRIGMGAVSHVLALAVFCSLPALSGCQRTKQARGVQPSGFLGDYSKLKPGEKGEALLVYADPEAKFSGYDKVLIEPVTIWGNEESGINDVSEEDLKKLAAALAYELKSALAEDYEVVSEAGPGVMVIRVAITEAKGSKVVLDTVSTIIPLSRAISEGKGLATGTASFVGRAGAEAEILDSLTKRQLLAAVDRRAGGKVLRGTFSKWDDVQQAYKYWAERLKTKLRELRARN